MVSIRRCALTRSVIVVVISQELLTEQIQILKGKIFSLEEEINRATKQEVGENMGPIMEVKTCHYYLSITYNL